MTKATLAARARETLATAERARLLRVRDAHDGAQGTAIEIGGRHLRNFTSNDYLGLANHPRVTERVRRELPAHGFGSGAAALLSGRSSLHAELERRIAAACHCDDALLFSSGYLANSGSLPALVGRSDFVAHDRLNHASLIDGVLASGARHRRYRHADPVAAAAALAARGDGVALLVTESIFSMDGDLAPLADLARLAADHGASLYVDDAHGFAVSGADGFANVDALPADAVRMVTFGKALGSVGAAIAGAAETIEFLVQRARTYVYDTALPPVCAAAALEALDILADEPARLQRLHANIAHFRSVASGAGLDLLPSSTPIQPIMVGAAEAALTLAESLRAAGFYVRAVRPPTVPRGTARLRITLSSDHLASDIEALVEALAEASGPAMP
ncbi:MAG: 8-amino-7-oxononanoate synthase [Gammaproteobacteria bacterium]|nr:8-amino-7-oxononanoate synthase [Gammaproteobacteria bacterium]